MAVVLQKSAWSLSHFDVTKLCFDVTPDQLVTEALMIAFFMIVIHVVTNCTFKRTGAEEDHLA